MDLDTFGKRLKHYAKTRHGGVGKMAEAVGVNPSQMSGYCSDAKLPDTDVLRRLRFAGVSVDWLFTGDGSPDADPVDESSVEGGVDNVSAPELAMREIAEIVDRWRKRT